MEQFISHWRRGKGCGGWVGGWGRTETRVRGSTNETVFSQQKRGCERKNWPSTELWFHFGDIESPDQTSEATKEQFSVPITAHSSWCDCCVAVISLVGSRRATAERLHKNSLPVAPACKTVRALKSIYGGFLPSICVCGCFLYLCVFRCTGDMFTWPFAGQFHYTYARPSSSHFNFTNGLRGGAKKKRSHRIDYHFTAGPQAMCL